MQIRRLPMLVMTSAFLLLELAVPAVAQDATRRCLDGGVKPILRNADGSLSPNPEFDNCLAGRPIAPPPGPPKPARAAAPASIVAGAAHGQSAAVVSVPTPAGRSAPLAPLAAKPAVAASALPVTGALASASADAAKPAQPPAVPLQKWTATNGQDVQDVLSTWARRAGWTIVWNAPTWQVAGNLTYEGEFLDAVRGLMRPYVIQKKLAKPEIYPEHNQNLIYVSEPK